MSDQSGHELSLGAEGPIVPNVDHIAVLVNMGVTREHAVRACVTVFHPIATLIGMHLTVNNNTFISNITYMQFIYIHC